MQCLTGRKTCIFIRCVIVLSCVYILADPIDRYFQEGVLGLVGYKSYLYSAQDLFFALCAVVGLSNLARYPLLGWILANIAYCSGRISAVPGLLSYCGCDVPVQCSGFIMHHACCLLYPFVCHQQKGAPAGEVVCLSAIHLSTDSGRNPVCRICRSELSSDRLIGRTGIICFRRMPAARKIPSGLWI